MRIAWTIAEWLFPALREWRIGYEMEMGGEDAVSEADARWIERRNALERGAAQ